MSYDVCIIGAGPAGLSAGIYAARAMRKVLIIEQAMPGGQQAMTDHIENYPGIGKEGVSGVELSKRMEEQARFLGVEILSDVVKQVDVTSDLKVVTTTYKGDIQTRSLIIASGRSPKTLGLTSEAEKTGRGVSYCATCDGAFYKGKKVAVVGGGNSALEEALFLTKFASNVILIHRRKEFRADRLIQDRVLKNKTIDCKLGYTVHDIEGKDTVEGIVIESVETGRHETLEVSGVFIYIGQIPNTMYIETLMKNQNGYLITNRLMQTNVKGVYAAGDVREKDVYQIVTAVADGAVAAVDADRYLTERENYM